MDTATTPEELAAQLHKVCNAMQGRMIDQRAIADLKHRCLLLLNPQRGILIPSNIRVDVSWDASGFVKIDIVDVDEERRRHERWMRFFAAWLGVPQNKIVYDGDPLP